MFGWFKKKPYACPVTIYASGMMLVTDDIPSETLKRAEQIARKIAQITRLLATYQRIPNTICLQEGSGVYIPNTDRINFAWYGNIVGSVELAADDFLALEPVTVSKRMTPKQPVIVDLSSREMH